MLAQFGVDPGILCAIDIWAYNLAFPHSVSFMRPHVLQVAYDQGLLQTRALMLQRSGYNVTSVLGNAKAIATPPAVLSSVKLIIIGFSESHTIRSGALHWFKQNHPEIPVIVLKFDGYEKFPEADAVTLSEDPSVWLQAVATWLKPS